jgi:hypothetical protein
LRTRQNQVHVNHAFVFAGLSGVEVGGEIMLSVAAGCKSVMLRSFCGMSKESLLKESSKQALQHPA